MKKLIIFFICLILTPYLAYSAVEEGDLAISVNYPGLGVRYFITRSVSCEGKWQSADDIGIIGLRLYKYFSCETKTLLFAGIEGDSISFKGTDSKGSGYAGEILVGGEYFCTHNFSLQLDFGPAYISIKDKDTSLKEKGMEFVVNIGLNYYFGKKKNEPQQPATTAKEDPIIKKPDSTKTKKASEINTNRTIKRTTTEKKESNERIKLR